MVTDTVQEHRGRVTSMVLGGGGGNVAFVAEEIFIGR